MVQPTTRATLHRLRGATKAFLEICEDAKALLADAPEAGLVRDMLVEALRGSNEGTPGSISETVEHAIAALGEV